MKTTRVLASLFVAFGLSATAAAAPPVMLNKTILTQISKEDRPSFHAAVAQALNTSADGQHTEWSSAPHGKRVPITVQLTPTQTTKTKSDQTCRFLVGDFARGATTEKWQFWFCKQPDGTWKASSQ